jgi:hypothetical protein
MREQSWLMKKHMQKLVKGFKFTGMKVETHKRLIDGKKRKCSEGLRDEENVY